MFSSPTSKGFTKFGRVIGKKEIEDVGAPIDAKYVVTELHEKLTAEVLFAIPFAAEDLANLGTRSHTVLTDIGTNTHAQIDTHIADATIHFTEASIDHGSIAGLGDDDHIQYAEIANTETITGVWNFRAATTWGFDGTGHDVIFYGDLIGKFMTWDNSSSTLIMNAATKILFGDSGTFIHQSADGSLLIESDINLTVRGATLTTIGVAGDIVLGDATQRVMRPHTDLQMHLGTNDFKFEEGWFSSLHIGYSTANVSNPPTDAQLDTAFGAPTSANAGFIGIVDDASGNTNVYLVYSTDTSWFVLTGTKAV